jgi:hypothetical protein
LVREPARLSRESSDDEQLGKLGVLDFDGRSAVDAGAAPPHLSTDAE